VFPIPGWVDGGKARPLAGFAGKIKPIAAFLALGEKLLAF